MDPNRGAAIAALMKGVAALIMAAVAAIGLWKASDSTSSSDHTTNSGPAAGYYGPSPPPAGSSGSYGTDPAPSKSNSVIQR